jgi:hypothetical protein
MRVPQIFIVTESNDIRINANTTDRRDTEVTEKSVPLNSRLELERFVILATDKTQRKFIPNFFLSLCVLCASVVNFIVSAG